MDEYNEFYDDKLRPMVRNAGYNNGKEVNVTPEKLRYIAHEILLFLGDDLPIGWIPVTERLPEEDGWYLAVTVDHSGHIIVDAERFHTKDGWGGKVTHWQPLPSGPKEAT